MKFKLTIDCDNSAFEDNASAEVARILRELSEKVESGRIETYILRDVNGNTVGKAEFTRGKK